MFARNHTRRSCTPYDEGALLSSLSSSSFRQRRIGTDKAVELLPELWESVVGRVIAMYLDDVWMRVLDDETDSETDEDTQVTQQAG